MKKSFTFVVVHFRIKQKNCFWLEYQQKFKNTSKHVILSWSETYTYQIILTINQ